MCDLTSSTSFEQMKVLEKEMKPSLDALRVKIHVVGCKTDLEVHKDTRTAVEKWSKANGYE